MPTCEPISVLSRDHHSHHPHHDHHKSEVNIFAGSGWASLLIIFLITAVIAYFVLVFWRPTGLLQVTEDGRTNGEVDQSRAIMWAVIIGLIVAGIFALFRSNNNGGGMFC